MTFNVKGASNNTLPSPADYAEKRRAAKRRPRKSAARVTATGSLIEDILQDRRDADTRSYVTAQSLAIRALELVPVLYPSLNEFSNRIVATMLTQVGTMHVSDDENLIDEAERATILTLTPDEQEKASKPVERSVGIARNLLRRAHNRLLMPNDAPLY